MGLDVFVFEYLMIPDTIKTREELEAFCDAHDGGWAIYGEDYKNLPKRYIKKIPMEFCDWEATFKKRGLNFDEYEESLSAPGYWYDFIKKDIISAAQGDTVVSFERLFDDEEPDPADATRVRINSDEIIPKTELVEVFAYGREVGYQRKGANTQFYNDGKWDANTIVSTKKMLLEDWKKYFSDPEDAYYGVDSAKHFKEHIIDNFKEGKTFVAYW